MGRGMKILKRGKNLENQNVMLCGRLVKLKILLAPCFPFSFSPLHSTTQVHTKGLDLGTINYLLTWLLMYLRKNPVDNLRENNDIH